MKRLIILIPVFCIFISNAFSQDSIFMKDKSCVLAKVTEILPEYVKYKKFNNLDGPTYSTLKVEIDKIVYQNGTVDIFRSDEDFTQKNAKSQEKSKKLHGILLAGFSFSTIGADASYTENKRGAAVGIGVDIPFEKKGNSIEVNLFFEEKGTEYSDIQQELDGELYTLSETVVLMDYATLSVMFKRFIGSKQLLHVKAGLYAGYRLSGDMKGKLIKMSDTTARYFNSGVDNYYTDFDAGANFGVGLNLPITKGQNPTHVIIEARYNLGISDIYKESMFDTSEKFREVNKNMLLVAGIRFPL